MGIGDIFKAKENAFLQEKVAELEALLTPEMRDFQVVQRKLEAAKRELEYQQVELNHRQKLSDDLLAQSKGELESVSAELARQKKLLLETNEEVLLQSFGLYSPQYDFASSDQYKERLDKIRKQQKEMIKSGRAASGSTSWTLNGSAAKGSKMVKDMQMLLLRAFNSECDEAISKVRYSNIDTSEKRITKSRDAISKLGGMMSIAISQRYYLLKLDELHLAYEYQVKKQDEKEEQRRIREELREQAKLEKEIAEARKNIEKEQKHYQNALSKLNSQIEHCSAEEKDALESKRAEISAQIEKLDNDMKQVDYREANQKAGYVYVISNIGSFGENVYKIGMTRRLEPMDRVNELGDASVPFSFDVHAMIFSDDAPKLEAALHRVFEDRKVNMVNTRREFFRATLEEIEKAVKENYDKTVEFHRVAPAEQYRQSLLMHDTASAL